MLTLAEWVVSLQMQAARVRGEETTLEVEHTLGHLAKDAQAMIGMENNGWAPLSEATMEGFTTESGYHFPGKKELGFTGQRSETDPLLRTGVLESSISAQAERRGLTIEGTIGSDDEIAIYQEMGTLDSKNPIPPRPFLSASLIRGQHVVEETMGQFLVAVLMNREPMAND